MGKTKRLQSPSTKQTGQNQIQNKSTGRRKSLLSLVAPGEVTEASLEVWRHLPSTIRHDPSMVSFQQENERLHAIGMAPDEDQFTEDIELREPDIDEDQSEYLHININVTNEFGEDCNVDNITTVQKHITHYPLHHGYEEDKNPWHKHSKLIFLLVAWFLSMAFMSGEDEKVLHRRLLSIDEYQTKNYLLPSEEFAEQIALVVQGSFLTVPYDNETNHFLTIVLQTVASDADNHTIYSNTGHIWKIPLPHHDELDITPSVSKRHVFYLNEFIYKTQPRLNVQLQTNIPKGLTVKLGYDATPVDMHVGVIYAAFVLFLLYVLIIYEVVHRTFAAIFSSIIAMGFLSALSDRPTMDNVVEWMDSETLLLLFSMMILVAVLTETGIFDYMAVYAFKISNGRIWPLIYTLCVISAIISAFLDNVTTILLMAPIVIKLCECLELNPVPVLMAIICSVNVGATTTPLGHTPNLLITGNHYIAKHGVTFLTFTLHTIVGVVLCMIQICIQLRVHFNDIHALRLKEPKEIKDMRREIVVWERTAASLTSYTKDSDLVRETLLKKVAILRNKLKKKEFEGVVSTETYARTLDELKHAYSIKNKPLLMKSGSVLLFVITLFFIQSVPQWQRLSLGWCAIIGVMLLLIIADKDDMDALMHRIEWTTLLFFAAMFVTMECLERLGLISWIGEQTKNIILSVGNEDAQLAVAIIIILWVSALTSSLVDSIPVTAMMVKVVVSLGENEDLNLPLQPLVWAVAFGPCLGGNGTLYGASGNVVCAGIAEQHGYKITFSEYFRVCFPIMIGSVLLTTGYLLLAHITFQWHDVSPFQSL